MSHSGEPRALWHEAGQRASVAFYEPGNVSRRWAGGFAGDGSLIEVIGSLDGGDVSVETPRPERATSDDMQRRAAITELRWRYVMEDVSELALPYSVTVQDPDGGLWSVQAPVAP